jgi:hypothetical protein
MKINVALNPKSIKQAKSKLLEIKKLFSQNIITREFLKDCRDYLLSRMDFHLQNSGLGSDVITNIMSSWDTNIIDNKCTLVNNDDKAVFVEFGVGIGGASNPHPFSSIEGYEYNMPSNAKDLDGEWSFFTKESNLDIPNSAIEFKAKANNGKVMVFTKGTKGTWFAYNALQDLRMNAKSIWQKTKERVIG